MIPLLDQRGAIVAVTKLVAVGIAISSAEYVIAPRHLKSDGLMSWTVGSLRHAALLARPVGPVLDALLCYPNVLGLLALRALIACVILLSPTTVVINPWIICPLALLIGLFTIRSPYGQDGADQMAWILITGLALISVVATPVAKTAFLWFIALQSCFSYATAGIAKASAEGWRDGRYLVGICNTRIYGNVHFAQFLASRPALAKLLSLLIIVWESLFPLVLIVPIPFALAILVSGMLFHLANAQIMGLNTFLWSFVATYPAILYCVQTRPW